MSLILGSRVFEHKTRQESQGICPRFLAGCRVPPDRCSISSAAGVTPCFHGPKRSKRLKLARNITAVSIGVLLRKWMALADENQPGQPKAIHILGPPVERLE